MSQRLRSRENGDRLQSVLCEEGQGQDGWQGLGNITHVSKEEFKKWIDSSHRKTKPFAEYASVKPLQDNSPEIEGIEIESTKNVNNSTNNVDSASLTDAIRDLYEKGKEYTSKLYQMKYFDVASTPDFMKQIGLTGERFTIKYGVLSRHIGKDESHALPESVWSELPEAIQNPFAITKRTDKEAGYRLYTAIKTDKGYVVVGADVKNAGKDIEVNSISTVFEREGGITQNEEVIYISEGITPEQQSLLKRPNSSQYTAGQELSKSKDSENSESANNQEEKSAVKPSCGNALSEKCNLCCLRQDAQECQRKGSMRSERTLSKAGQPKDDDGPVREADCEDCPKCVGRWSGSAQRPKARVPQQSSVMD